MIGKYNGAEVEFDENALENSFVFSEAHTEVKTKYQEAEKERDSYKAKYEALDKLYRDTFSHGNPAPTQESPVEKIQNAFKEVFGQ